MAILEKRRINRVQVSDPWEVILVKDVDRGVGINVYKVMDYSEYGWRGQYTRTKEIDTVKFPLDIGEEVVLNGRINGCSTGKRVRVVWVHDTSAGFEFF